jgi:hypothetical protein
VANLLVTGDTWKTFQILFFNNRLNMKNPLPGSPAGKAEDPERVFGMIAILKV